MSENYLQAKIYLEKKNKEKAIETLKNLIYEDDSTYSTLSLFLVLLLLIIIVFYSYYL